ncbi:YecA family protein [Desulfobacula sp.]|uniref:YecA family protein n=1 Tax=Desulfobacula sp. TaxID=2593537 RepID=UPI0039B865FD
MKIGRNAPCPCGSGKKYKKCCLDKDQQTGRSHPNKDDFIQPPPQELDRKIRQEDSGIQIRPYVIAKMCDPTEKHVQELFLRHPERKRRNPISVSQIRSLSTEQLIAKLSERGVRYDQEQFLDMCEKEGSAWDVAEKLWPKQIKSFEKDVSDVTGLSACMLWQRLYDEKKLSKVSVEMLDDWMEKGYKQLDKDRFEACSIWMRVWETFKADYDLANRSIDEIDAQFNGSQSFFNWCQDFEMELINASIDSKEFAELGVTYLKEFLACFADEDAIFINQFKSSLGECYCRSGDQEAGEKVMRELIRQYPDRMAGYIGMEMVLSIKKMSDEALTLEERLKILEGAKKIPVIDGKDYDLDRRIFDLKKEIANLEAKR